MKVGRDWIQSNIPHQGTMCLLHCVDHWDTTEICCRANSHTMADNPLRNAKGLPISAGIEYAAQAMAVHGALLTPITQPPGIGYLTSVRKVQWWTSRLDVFVSDMLVQAIRISGNEVSLLYEFNIRCDDTLLMAGRASVMTQPTTPSQNHSQAR